jgi:hypothetical protein
MSRGPEEETDVDVELAMREFREKIDPKRYRKPADEDAERFDTLSSRYSHAFFSSCGKMIFMLLFVIFVLWLTSTFRQLEVLFLGSD